MRFAYADPPYLGCCGLYDHHHPDGRCWDDVETHALLIRRLIREFPEGWALSLHAPSITTYSRLVEEAVIHEDIRWGSWVKPFAAYKVGVNPAWCWEPVLFYGGRSAAARGGREVPTVRDYVQTTCDAPAVAANITLKRGTKGAKPPAFCFWLFEFLGANGGDEFTDLFPGSGAVSRAWKEYAWANPSKAGAA